MARFCDGCRMEGYATGELVGMKTEEIGSKEAAFLVDDRGDPSEFFWSDGRTKDQIITEIDVCQGLCKIAKSGGRFRKSKVEFDCPVLGSQSIERDTEAYRTMARIAGI